MIELKGEYNSAVVLLEDESGIEEGTREQIIRFLNNKHFSDAKIRIMPDCHVGYGACIGFTMTLNDYIIPNIVGVDLSCGVLAVKLGKAEIDLPLLDQWIRENIAHGYHVNSNMQNRAPYLKEFYRQMDVISKKIGVSANRNRLSIGSLGGGNHFIELGVDEGENKWLTIHTGSRKFGNDLASYYQNIAKSMSSEGEPRDLAALVRSKEGAEYLQDIKCAAMFASVNRVTIAYKIIKYLRDSGEIADKKFEDFDSVESVHNYIGDDGIIRKGAVSAYKNERLVIPFNMEDGLIIGVGKGNPEWNYSAPHGAGRVLGRKQAFNVLNLDDALEGMRRAGVYTTSMNRYTLDEAKGAYKDKDLIVKAIEDNVHLINFVKPVYNFKAEDSKR